MHTADRSDDGPHGAEKGAIAAIAVAHLVGVAPMVFTMCSKHRVTFDHFVKLSPIEREALAAAALAGRRPKA